MTLTDSFIKRMKALQDKENNPGLKLRIIVDGGGCQGFEYRFELTGHAEESDNIIERDGAIVLIDDISLPYMKGSEIDYVDDLIGAHFKINNPNADSSCGCGTSFSVKS